jgi:hypothetical protein
MEGEQGDRERVSDERRLMLLKHKIRMSEMPGQCPLDCQYTL